MRIVIWSLKSTVHLYLEIEAVNIFFFCLFTDLKSRRNLSFSEDSDLSCDDVLERSSQKSKAEVSGKT